MRKLGIVNSRILSDSSRHVKLINSQLKIVTFNPIKLNRTICSRTSLPLFAIVRCDLFVRVTAKIGSGGGVGLRLNRRHE